MITSLLWYLPGFTQNILFDWLLRTCQSSCSLINATLGLLASQTGIFIGTALYSLSILL